LDERLTTIYQKATQSPNDLSADDVIALNLIDKQLTFPVPLMGRDYAAESDHNTNHGHQSYMR
jgi:hypothetical protein